MKLFPLLLGVLFLLSVVVTAVPDTKLYHDVKIAQVIITEQSLRCSREVLVIVDVKNAGTFAEDVYVELINKELGVHMFSPSTQVAARSREQVLMPLYLPEEPQGKFTFDTYLYTPQNIQPSFHAFTFAGCKTIQLTSYIQDTSSPSRSIVPLSSPVQHEQPIDFLFVSTLFIVACLVILGSLALFKMF